MKLAVVGSGMIVSEFFNIWPYLKNVELNALYGRKASEEKLKELKAKHKIKNIFFDYEALLQSEADTVYIALPNSLHFDYARKALEADKNVILEKPMTSTYKEALILNELARSRELLLFEAITTQYLPNYKKIKELLPELGNIKIVQCNYSQYSSRYDRFRRGEVLPAFDPEFSGGALMDLNIYNIHYTVGLFGKPVNVEYYPNMERQIDTSGILILDYGSFKCVCVGAKDCRAPIANTIQGDKGCICQATATNVCQGFQILLNGKEEAFINVNDYEHRMVNEFIEFSNAIESKDLKKCYTLLDHSLTVCEIQNIARNKSGLVFPTDRTE